jgi:hypothetical protein
MNRPATKMDILAAIEQLDALPKPRGTSAQTVIVGYEIALDGVPFEALQQAVTHFLRYKSFFPSPSELYNQIRKIENAGRRSEERAKRQQWDEDKPKTSSGFGVFRPATKRIKHKILTELGVEPKTFLPALDNVSGLGLQIAVNRIRLKRPSWDYQPLTPASLRSAVDRMEAEMRWRETNNDQPQLKDDPEAVLRAKELMAMVRGE